MIYKTNMDTSLYKKIGELAKKWRDYPNEYNPEDSNNRQILIEKNMKLAVGTALRWRGMLDEDELVSIALLALTVAYDKYKPEKVTLRNTLLGLIGEDTTPEDFVLLIGENMPYGDKIIEKFANGMPQTPAEMREWVKRNIKPAKFSSIVPMWVKAYVLSHLEKYGKPVRVPEDERSEAQFDCIDDGDAAKYNKLLHTESNWEEREEKWTKLMDGVPEECKRVLEMRYGVACDEPMTLREIACEMGRDVRWVKRCLVDCEDTLKWNAVRHKLNISDFLN